MIRKIIVSVLTYVVLLCPLSGYCSICENEVLAKKCHAIAQKIISLAFVQSDWSCKSALKGAALTAEESGYELMNLDSFSGSLSLNESMRIMKYAELIDCEKKEEIILSIDELMDLKNQITETCTQ